MIGKYTIEIGWKEFLAGMTSSSETEDGGFSPETNAVNITSDQTHLGVLYASADIIDKSTGLSGNIIASCSDSDQGIGVNRYVLTDSGKFNEVNSSGTITNRQTGIKTYQYPYSDMAVYRNELYSTSLTDITKASGATLGTFSETWGSATSGIGALTTGLPHPMVVYEDNLWVGDGNKLHRWDGTTGTSGYLTLRSDAIIQTLAVDPSTGKMVISTTSGLNYSDTKNTPNAVYTYNGATGSLKPDKVCYVDDMITAMYPFGGTLFVFYGNSIGYWNGGGISFLRKLKGVTLDGDSLVYKQKVTNIGKVLMVADGLNILCLEESLPGKKIWYYVTQQNAALNTYLGVIFNMGNNVLGISYTASGPSGKFCIFNRSARTAGTLNFYSKKYKFQRPIYVREIHIEYYDQVSASATTGVITLIDQNFTNVATPSLTNDGTSSTFEITRTITSSKKFRTLQMNYSNSSYTSTVAGIRRFLINYDVVE